MRTFTLLVILLTASCLSGCFEMNEELEVNANGSGNFAVKMDMSQMVDMMQAFIPAAELEKAKLEESKDTTIQMKELIDTATNISSEKKRCYGMAACICR